MGGQIHRLRLRQLVDPCQGQVRLMLPLIGIDDHEFEVAAGRRVEHLHDDPPLYGWLLVFDRCAAGLLGDGYLSLQNIAQSELNDRIENLVPDIRIPTSG